MRLKLVLAIALIFVALPTFAQETPDGGLKQDMILTTATPNQSAQWLPSIVVSFGISNSAGVQHSVPTWADHWVQKNAKKFPGLRFSQIPSGSAANYLVVFSSSASELAGFDPIVRTDTSTSTTPISGSGTVTDYYGRSWDFTYSGMETTTTTTSTRENLPYTIDSNSLYASVYDGQGKLVSRHWRTVSTKQGGETYSTLGYNLGAALSAIHLKSGLLHDAIQDIATKADFDPASGEAADTACRNKSVGKHVTISGKRAECYEGIDGKKHASR
jgi:YD repeat-containing protein